jgi:two-component system response regulator HydG
MHRRFETDLPKASNGNGRDVEDIVAADPGMRAIVERIHRIAAADVSVLITGESGTGKEIVARTIHRGSGRAAGPFVPINCGGLAESLLDSELFGYRRGAFTGAVADKKGLVDEADGGVLFLDELGEMPPAMQVVLLRFLDTGEFRPVGHTKLRQSDVRLIAATNRDLTMEIAVGRFRHDLFYRLGVVTIDIPPLRERRADIEALAMYYIRRAAPRLGKPVDRLGEGVLSILQNYPWPGNVRQLRNVIESAVALSASSEIALADLPPALGASEGSADPHGALAGRSKAARLLDVIREHGGNHSQAAAALGVSRTTLWRRLRRAELLGG